MNRVLICILHSSTRYSYNCFPFQENTKPVARIQYRVGTTSNKTSFLSVTLSSVSYTMSALVLITLTVICFGVPFLLKFFIKKYRFWKLVNKIPGPDGGFVLGSAMDLLKCPADRTYHYHHFCNNSSHWPP